MSTHPRITTDPAVMGGTPVVRGTRVPVDLLLRKLGEGATMDDLLASYPHLARADVHAALLYAADAVSLEETLDLSSSQPTACIT
jgi:uncharacterized protein (DUF433 family)